MHFNLPPIQELLSKSDLDIARRAILDNLTCEERVDDARLNAYEEFIRPNVKGNILLYGSRDSWSALHDRYFWEKVAIPNSVTFNPRNILTHRKMIAEEDWIIRMERIDGGFKEWDAGTSAGKSSIQILTEWTEKSHKSASTLPPKTGRGSLSDLGAMLGVPTKPTPSATVQDLFDYWNTTVRKDHRPSFVAFQAELKNDLNQPDWAERYCIRLGLGHYFTDAPVTLALMRYQVSDVITAISADLSSFCAPTVLDGRFFEFFHPSPQGCDWGFAALLNSQLGDDHLASELLHRRIDYKPEHLWRIATINQPKIANTYLQDLRNTHVRRMRRTCNRDDFGVVR